MDEFVAVFAHGPAKRTGIQRGLAGQSQQSAHVDADQFVGATPIMAARERFTLSTLPDSSCTTMRSVMASKISSQCRLRLFDAREQARIFKGHGGVTGNSLQKIAIIGRERTAAPGKAQ